MIKDNKTSKSTFVYPRVYFTLI